MMCVVQCAFAACVRTQHGLASAAQHLQDDHGVGLQHWTLVDNTIVLLGRDRDVVCACDVKPRMPSSCFCSCASRPSLRLTVRPRCTGPSPADQHVLLQMMVG